MARSRESFNKKEVNKKKEKKRKEKLQKKQDRKENKKTGNLDDMIAYVDENGNITSTPPDPEEKDDIELEDIEVSVPKKEDIDPDDSRRKGKVVYFNESKGFGFIEESKTKERIFVHISNMANDVMEGNMVSFLTEKGEKGPVAVQVEAF